MKYLPIFLTFTAVLLAAVSGCGESDAEVHLTKAQFIKKGEEICSTADREQFVGAGRYTGSHPGAAESDLVVPVGLPPIEKEIRRLKALGTPEGDEEKVEALVKALEVAVRDAKEDPLDVLAAETNPFKKADKLAREYGFDICAKNP